MKLYISPGACSLSPHIVLREAFVPFELETVDLATKKTATGEDFNAISSKGDVPALLLDDGTLLTEGPAILQYISDLRPEAKLLPLAGTIERYRALEWLTFIGTELHKQMSPLFHTEYPDTWKQHLRAKVIKRLAWVAEQLGDKPYLMGAQLTAADAYLFVMLTWAKPTKVDLSQWPVLVRYAERMRARPKVAEALAAESALRKRVSRSGS